MRISDWSSDVCSSDLRKHVSDVPAQLVASTDLRRWFEERTHRAMRNRLEDGSDLDIGSYVEHHIDTLCGRSSEARVRSEEHTSELQSLMRNSYAVFCLKKKRNAHSSTHTLYIITHHSTSQQQLTI